jgi:hypothetical protein
MVPPVPFMNGVFTLLSAGTGGVWSSVVLCLDGYGGLEVLLLLILPLYLWSYILWWC